MSGKHVSMEDNNAVVKESKGNHAKPMH